VQPPLCPTVPGVDSPAAVCSHDSVPGGDKKIAALDGDILAFPLALIIHQPETWGRLKYCREEVRTFSEGKPWSWYNHGGLALHNIQLSLAGEEWSGRCDLYCDGQPLRLPC
jgi:hypothetical protein